MTEKKLCCASCGKPNQDKDEDFCYGCGHILCTDCCFDSDGYMIGHPHNIRTHRREFLKKVELFGSWQSEDLVGGKKA